MCSSIVSLSGSIRITHVILHALKNDKVVEAYENMDFECFKDGEGYYSTLEGLRTLTTPYENDCIFMYQPYDMIMDEFLEGGM